MTNPTARPLIRANGVNQELPDGTALDGTTNDYPLVMRQAGAALTLLSTDTVIDGSNYLWEKSLLPTGRQAFFEVVASGTNVGAPVAVTVGLYAGTTLVTNASLTINSLTPARQRSIALTLVDGTEYTVRYRTTGVAGSIYVYSARILIR